jgi:hypothetical protein
VTKTSIMPPVLLSELAGAAFSGSIDTATHWVRRVGGTVDQDWAGRPIVDAEIARKVLEDSRKAAAEEAERQSQYDAYLVEWQRQYLEVGDRAYAAAAERELGAEQQALRDSDTFWIGLPATVSPRGRSIAQQACNEARARWEESNRRQSYDEWSMKRRK